MGRSHIVSENMCLYVSSDTMFTLFCFRDTAEKKESFEQWQKITMEFSVTNVFCYFCFERQNIMEFVFIRV